jgi:RNA polymerase sigma-70 factor (ECF subfamily)
MGWRGTLAWQAGQSGGSGRGGMSELAPVRANDELELLMARCQAGDSGAANALIQLLSPRLQRFFVADFAARTEADDLLQETWLRIHRVRHTYRAGEPVLPWFYAIARSIRVDHHRKARRTTAREQPLDGIPEVAAAEPAGAGESPELEALLASLPASQREVIEMLKITGMSLEEVARATSSTVGSVKQKAHRAYEKLRSVLGGMGMRSAAEGGSA